MRGKLNKLTAGVMSLAMAFGAISALAPISTYAAETECKHEITTQDYTKEPTCTESGYYNEVCVACDKVLSTNNEEPALGHYFNMCTFENGKIKTVTCDRCGVAEDFSPSVDESECDHTDYQFNYNYVGESCEEDGYSGDLACSQCGKVIEMGHKINAIGHHDWEEDEYIEPTCTEDGKVIYQCNECGEFREEVVKSVGHQFGYNILHKPTCTEEGEKAGKCRICGLEDWQTIPALGHSWDAGKVTKEPTTTTEGTKTYTCKTCGETKEETLAKLPADTKPDTKPSDGTTTTKPDTKPSDGTTTTKPDTKPSDGTTTTKPDTKPSDGTTTAKPDTKPSTGTTTKKQDTKPAKVTKAKVGTKFAVKGNEYVVTRVDSEVRFSKAKAGVKSLNIPASIKVKGVTYKVTSISANAVKSNKKIKSVTVGANVKNIASKAFNNCPNLKKVVIKSSKLSKKTTSKKSFSKVNKKMVIKVPSKVKKSYKKIFKGLTVK